MKRICFIITGIVTVFLYTAAAFAQPLNIAPDCSYILMDAKTGQVIAAQNEDVKLHPASTTKIMTAIIALEEGRLDQVMNVSNEAVDDIGPGGMNIGIMPGEDNLTLDNLLHVMLIKSANETANIIAENVGGSMEKFIEKMNQKAAQLGAVNTLFVNPCGKDNAQEDAAHLTTARDMALIARYGMTLPKFREIVGMEYYRDMPITNKHEKWDELRTTNKLLWYSNSYPYTLDNIEHNYLVNGIKTGFTNAAGNNLISAATNEDGIELIAAVMHVTEGDNRIYTYTKALLRYGFEHFANQKYIDKGQVVKKSITVQDAKGDGSLDLVAASDFSCALPVDKNEWNITPKENITLPVKAPVKQGDILGSVQYERNGVVLGKVDLIASRSIEMSDKAVKQAAVKAKQKSGNSPLSWLTVLLFIVLGFLLLRIVLRKISRRVKKRKTYRI